MPRLRFVPVLCAIGCAAAFPTCATAAVAHDGTGTVVVTDPPAHDSNICGFQGTFRMTRRFEWHSTEGSNGFHFQLTEVSRWTVTFDNPALGVWSGRGTETDVFTASPGDVLTFHVIFNGSEGPVRIHELQQVLVAADGTLRVDIEKVTTDYGACPS
jgi:hypothetical protein